MINFKTALLLSNLVSKCLNFLGYEATSFPGKIVQKIYPRFLKESGDYIASPRFAVTGTNGKTTTSGILSNILKEQGYDSVNNKLGANMPNGIITALANSLYEISKEKGFLEAKGVVLESDEAYFQVISNRFVFDYLIITNLFRDQLDRYGEMDIARKKIIKGIELNPGMKIIMNADDPSLSVIEEELKHDKERFIYFGISSVKYEGYEKNSKSPSEGIYCPLCNKKIEYRERYYAQLGDWSCSCFNRRRKLDIGAKVTVFQNKSSLEVVYKFKTYKFEVNLSGLYNAYNALGAIAGALAAGVDQNIIQKALDNYSPVFGRHQKLNLANKGTLTIHLIKNPVGASEVLRGLRNLEKSKMMLIINDNYADGRDVSWLWDADFEALANFNNVIYTSGTRSYDIALRLKYAGFNLNLLEPFEPTKNVTNSIEKVIGELNEGENLVVLVTYTGLLEFRKNSRKLYKKGLII